MMARRKGATKSNFHPDTWNPAWSVATILTGLLSFMLENTPTLGSMETTTYEKKQFAKKSLAFNLKNAHFRELFPDICDEINSRLNQIHQLKSQIATGDSSGMNGAAENAGARKHITDSLQPLKGNTKLKDDPGGNKKNKMDGPKLISSENLQSFNKKSDHVVNSIIGHQINYNSSTIELNSRQHAIKTIASDRVTSSSSSASSTTTATANESNETNESNECTNNNKSHAKSSSSHRNNSLAVSPFSATSITITTATTPSAANDHKYLHKKFKRIASTTSDNLNDVDENQIHQSHQTSNRNSHNHATSRNSSSSGSSCSEATATITDRRTATWQPHEIRSPSGGLEYETESKFTANTVKKPQQIQVRDLSSLKEQDESGSYIIVNGTGRLTPLFQTVETVSIADTGYGSDGELKTAISNNILYNKNAIGSDVPGQSLAISQSPMEQHHVTHYSVLNNNNNNVLSRIPITSAILSASQTSPVIVAPTSCSIGGTIVLTNSSSDCAASFMKSSSVSQPSPSIITTTLLPSQIQQQQQQLQRLQTRSDVDQTNSGRHSCPFCNLNCTKPSVLQKHIRTHTNERPYLCDKCSFAFKTKSNYYKHCRSRSHALRVKGIEPQPEDENSIGSDPDGDPDISNSSSDVISRTASPFEERTSSPAIQYQAAVTGQQARNCIDKPYKPKFHNAGLYVKEEFAQLKNHHYHQQQQQQLQYQPLTQQLPPQQQPHPLPNNSYHTNQNPHQTYSQSQARISQQEAELASLHYHQQQQLQLALKNRLDYAAHHSPHVQQVPASASSHAEPNRPVVDSTANKPTVPRTFVSSIGHQLNVEEHIQYLISRNEAIINTELPLQKKYPKVSAKTKNTSTVLSNTNSRLAFTLANKQYQQQQQMQLQHQHHQQQQPHLIHQQTSLTIASNGMPSAIPVQLPKAIPSPQSHPQQQQLQLPTLPPEATAAQPLNLSKIAEHIESNRKRVPSESFVTPSTSDNIATGKIPSSHPQNPERSIIKNLLLNARGQAIPNGEGEQNIHPCVSCKMEFHSAEDLRCHSTHYCQGGPSSAPISPVGSPAFKYSRSNSISVNLPELNNPNSLAKLARSSLLLSRNPSTLAKLAWSQLKTKPSNLVLTQLSVNTNPAPNSSGSQPTTATSSSIKMTETPLPSPGPLLGKTPLVEAYNNNERKTDDVIITKMHEEGRNFVKGFSPKRLRFEANVPSPIAAVPEASPGPSPVAKAYSMCGGEITPLEKKEEPMKRFFSSGGCMIPLSECPDIENSPKIIRTSLLSGGSFQEISPKPTMPQTPKPVLPLQSLASNLPMPNLLNPAANITRFQFPPINPITAYNPLTLPPVSAMGSILPSSVSHGDKVIPFVPGIPGPNTLMSSHMTALQPPRTMDSMLNRNLSPNRKNTPSPLIQCTTPTQTSLVYSQQTAVPSVRIDDEPPNSGDFFISHRTSRPWIPPPPAPETSKKSFNFTRIADNLSPRRPTVERLSKSPERPTEMAKQFNHRSGESLPSVASPLMPLHVDVSSSSSKEKELPPSSSETSASSKSEMKSKFLRPTSLPLKPGTFTPKCHHGITPTANTLPLISPETPRPSKVCVQLYLNGHAYTYLGLKSSTKMFYCTVNCPQPSYIANMHRLSMYSVWQVCAENNPHPLGLKPKCVMSLYDSRQRNLAYSTASIKSTVKTVHSQPTVMTPFENNSGQFYYHQLKSAPEQSTKTQDGSQKTPHSGGRLVGGYESNEDYTYVRGRGRGRYVCSECGIRCKKPSMLKKHIRTHTDVRPYTCQHCSFSFKTKGNLTKHMQSKTHYKKCMELGINPGPMPADCEFAENDFDTDQQSINSGGGRTSSAPGESDSDDYSDGNEGETESSDTDESKSRLPEHEAARCLLSLSMTPPANSMSPNSFSQRSQYPSYHHQQPTQFTESLSSSGRRSSDEPLHSNRRVISFTSPKPPFDYQKQEQYFSNPSINLKPAKVEDTVMKPIDLTKPRRNEQIPYRASDFVCELSSESGFLKSLVSITDKIRPKTEHSFGQAMNKLDQNVQLQAYLTEQALQYTKIKQSQMSRTFNDTVVTTTTSVVVTPIPTIKITDVSKVSTPEPIAMESRPEKARTPTPPPPVIPQTVVAPIATAMDSEERSTVQQAVLDHRIPIGEETETMLEEPSKSVSPIPSSGSKTLVVPSASSAQSVASEYLKMTSAESRVNRAEESEDSCSDQEVSAGDAGPKSSADFTGIVPPTVIVGEDGFKNTSNEVQPMFRVHLNDDGRPVCKICSKTFQKQHQMVLHMNIHYMERKFKCEPCAVSFRTQGHLQKHERSEAHKNKVMMNSTFGVPTTSNPRPFECSDCKVAFRIHGHLAKHLRSKTHVQKLECLQKLPFGTYAEIERAGISLTEIDTTDCDNSLASLRELAQRLIEKDPAKMGAYTKPSCIDGGTNSQESGSEDSPDPLPINDGSEYLAGSSSQGSSSVTDGPTTGVKRKFESFSSCSNDSTSNAGVQSTNASSEMTVVEKRVRTSSCSET